MRIKSESISITYATILEFMHFLRTGLCLQFSFKHTIIWHSMALVCLMENICLLCAYLKISVHNQNLCEFAQRVVSPWEKGILQSHFEVILLPNTLTCKLLLCVCKLCYINMTHTSTLSSNSATIYLKGNMSRNLENGVNIDRGHDEGFFSNKPTQR
jgi:hypothetical protein